MYESLYLVEGILSGVPLLANFSNTWMNLDLLKGWMYVLYFIDCIALFLAYVP